MNKNTSILMVAAVAGILVASAPAVTMTNAAFARLNVAIGGDGGIGGAGGAGGVGGNGGYKVVRARRRR